MNCPRLLSFNYALCSFIGQYSAKLKRFEMRVEASDGFSKYGVSARPRPPSYDMRTEYASSFFFPLVKLPSAVEIVLPNLPPVLEHFKPIFIDGQHRKQLPEAASFPVLREYERTLLRSGPFKLRWNHQKKQRWQPEGETVAAYTRRSFIHTMMQDVGRYLEDRARQGRRYSIECDFSMMHRLNHVNLLLDIHIEDPSSEHLPRQGPTGTRSINSSGDIDGEWNWWRQVEKEKGRAGLREVLREFWERTGQ